MFLFYWNNIIFSTFEWIFTSHHINEMLWWKVYNIQSTPQEQNPLVHTEIIFDRSQFVSNKIFLKNSYGNWYITSSSFFWHLLCPNRPIIRGAVSLWTFGRIPKSATFPSKTMIYLCSSILQKLTVTRIIDQFGRKRCQKKRKDLS